MSKLYFLIPVVFLLTAWLGMSMLIRNRVDYSIPQTKAIPLKNTMQVAYTPSHDRLNIIVLKVKNPSVADVTNYKMDLLDQSDHEIKSVEFSARNVGDPSDLRLQFDPIPNSRDIRTLRVTQLSDTGILHVYVDSGDRLSFTSYYRSASKIPDFSLLVGRIIDFFKNDPTFFVSWSITLLLLTSYRLLWPRRS